MYDNSLGSLYKVTSGKTRSICAENPTGEKGNGAKENASGASSELGKGWKCKPCITIQSGETAILANYKGSGIIKHIWMTADTRMLRAGVLRFYWDREEYPSVEVPFGDFFGMGLERSFDINSLPVVCNPKGGMNCYWPMPFKEGFKITFTNEYHEEVKGFFYQITFDEQDIEDDSAYFHASYNRSMTTRELPQHTILSNVSGKGHYVGTSLSWMQYSEGWWGEGEIKFYMDGDKDYPTICGTGTEDYFGGAWGFEGKNYSTPFLGFPYSETGEGKIPKHSLYRWHVMDPIRFESELKVTIQALGWWPNAKYQPLTDDIASVAYWYQIEPHNKFQAFPKLQERWGR